MMDPSQHPGSPTSGGFDDIGRDDPGMYLLPELLDDTWRQYFTGMGCVFDIAQPAANVVGEPGVLGSRSTYTNIVAGESYGSNQPELPDRLFHEGGQFQQPSTQDRSNIIGESAPSFAMRGGEPFMSIYAPEAINQPCFAAPMMFSGYAGEAYQGIRSETDLGISTFEMAPASRDPLTWSQLKLPESMLACHVNPASRKPGKLGLWGYPPSPA
jgi:hypothetical protein